MNWHFVRKNLIILRFDYDSAPVIFETITLERKKTKVLNTIIMSIIQNNFSVNLKMINFLSPFTHLLLVRKNSTPWPQTVQFLAALHEKIKANIHNLISINAFKKYGQYFKQNCFIFFFEFENC